MGHGLHVSEWNFTQLMRMYRGRAALGSFRLQKPYITLALSKVSVISARPPPATHRREKHPSTTARCSLENGCGGSMRKGPPDDANVKSLLSSSYVYKALENKDATDDISAPFKPLNTFIHPRYFIAAKYRKFITLCFVLFFFKMEKSRHAFCFLCHCRFHCSLCAGSLCPS